MKSFTIMTVLTAGLMLGACATVEIAPGQSEQAQSEKTIDSADRLALRRSAKALTYEFAQNDWTPKANPAAQNATAILLGGIKAKAVGPQGQDIYIARVPSANVVRADIYAAQKQVRGLADMAVRVLSGDPDAKALSKDLRALEKALLASRKAESTFTAALRAKGVSDVTDDMRDLTGTVDALRVVTDSVANRSRAKASDTVSS